MSLPGDPSPADDLARMIRVNHAGEYGARRIYEGQLAVLRGRPAHATIAHMKAQEEAHLQAFEALLVERRVRPTALLPFWHVGGFLLGAATALMGEKAAMACTVAVEEVIDEHYAAQEARLPVEEAPLRDTIAQFRADEMEHHATGLEHGAEQAPLYSLLHQGIKTVTRTAIWLSTRL
jgi:ubiquinone biosynthesis monooxygenase Coq7